ncbi:two-component regulator propeller domain-containing protein [Spirosoma sp. KNUC1025]|uniref:ligand-binding sensor domain-containing protein n=1 Tax=Spirosoma sp. KNUC1025 TaxID=2894082 RepID=UPI00386D4149|nr:histidine kinase [Spirosoma sp. KNUC1025]
MRDLLQSSVIGRWIAASFLVGLMSGYPVWLWGQTAPIRWQVDSSASFERLTTEQGLTNHFVITIMQDRKGYLWFGTATGLDKYDGYRFTNYKFDPRDTTSLTKNQVLTLWEDPNGLIWVGTSEATCRFDPRTETFTRLERSPVNPYAFKYVQSFQEDKAGNLWVGGSFEGELRQIDRKTGIFSAINYTNLLGVDSSRTERLHQIFKDKSGTLWVGSPTGLHRMHWSTRGPGQPAQVSFTHYRHNPTDPRSLSHSYVTGLFEDHRGVLWVITADGVLHALDRPSGQFTRYPLDPTHRLVLYRLLKTYIAEDPDGNLWIGTLQNGLFKFDVERRIMTRFSHDPTDPGSIISNGIYTLLVDKSGTLWAGTSDGVIKLDPNRKPFGLYRHNPLNPHSLSQNNIGAICEDRQGIIWIGTSRGGLNAFNKTTGQFTRFQHDSAKPNSLRNNSVGAILEDREGVLWVSNSETLSRYDRKRNTFFHYRLSHPFVVTGPVGTDIYTLYEDRQGLFWMGTTNGILSFDRKTGKTVSYPYNPDNPNQISDWVALSILEDRKGNLWIGPGSQALTRFDRKAGTYKQYRYDSRKPGSISSATIPCIYEDSRGALWFGTGEGGLCRFDHATETFTTFTEQDGLAGNSVFSMLEDNAGNLWLGTNKGLSKFSLAKQTFTNYSADEGLQGNMFTTLFTDGAAFKGRDGTLYFGGTNGFNAFDPTKIRPNPHVPTVVITQFKLFDKLLPGKSEAREIVLDHNQNFFSFEFAALNYTNSLKNQYAYQLVGLEKDWVHSGTRRYASYTDLGPGTYIFRVKGSNNDGLWNEKGTSIRIIIQPAWWQTVWFKILVGLAFAGVLYAAYRYRINQIRREQAIRDQISRDLHDDVGGILSGISFYSEAARQMHQQERYQDSYQMLIKIADNARQTISQMSDVVWSMRSDTNNAGQLAQRLESVGRELLTARGIQLNVTADAELERLSLRPDVVRNLYLIGKEALHNVAKHSGATQAQLTIRQTGGKVYLRIEDNGKGVGDNAIGQGNGLDSMKKRAEAIGASYSLNSQPNNGTTVYVEQH